LSLEDKKDWMVVASWMVCALLPSIPHPVLVIYGEQGAAKSTRTRIIRSVLDPNTGLVRSPPRDEALLAIAAQHNLVLAFDNLSEIRATMSDAICRVSTGGSVTARRHYTNGEEYTIHVNRPVIINGIPADLVERPDLADRALFLKVPGITDEQ